MNLFRRLPLSALALTLGAATLHAQGTSPQLAGVLAQLDTASHSFKDARADLKADYYERVIKDTSTQTGPIYFERHGASIEMGAVLSEQGAKPKVIDYSNGTLRMFDPGVDQITQVKAGPNQGQFESFLTLGFGGSGHDLATAWNIDDKGPEVLSDGGRPVKTEKLDLVSKDPGIRGKVSHVTIWVDPARSVSLKQIFYLPSGDTRTNTYSNIKLNVSIDKGTFKMRTDGHTTTVNH
jgi:outer membrane lipoprotein-sorting protein